ncbi:hypothetical protein [Bacillus multifaciens]|uniref:hypothetical protein n=1 Tax=Bacillus multifaciens TaxID=3068506 RepID=UPI0027412D35|nr:hypothetical protein [Bacillus sp. WLY-B-L8]MDP7979916.1 hypothetical protein [Bacillus sp. WLY-B-L8]
MKCVECCKDFSEEYLYCPFCGTQSNSHGETHNIIDAGTNNINIGMGVNSKQDIYIDNFNVSKQEELIVKYEDRLDREVIGGVKGYKNRFQISGVLSIVSAVVTIVGYLFSDGDYRVFLCMITFGLILYAIDSKGKYQELNKDGIVYKNGRPILCEEDGKVYKVSKYGSCPICKGRVNIYYDKNIDRTLGQCINNKDHLYTYDHTTDIGVPYVYFHIYDKR